MPNHLMNNAFKGYDYDIVKTKVVPFFFYHEIVEYPYELLSESYTYKLLVDFLIINSTSH